MRFTRARASSPRIDRPALPAITAFRGPIEGRSPLPATRRTIPSRNSVVQLAALSDDNSARCVGPALHRYRGGTSAHVGWMEFHPNFNYRRGTNNFINVTSPFVQSLTIF